MPEDVRAAIERFLASSRDAVAIEPGDDPLPLISGRYALESRGAHVRFQCWTEDRNLVRTVRSVALETRGRLELQVERFGAPAGNLLLLDRAQPSSAAPQKRGARLKYRESFRRSLKRQFPQWRIAELSAEPDLHHSLSPAYPRALLRRGAAALAAIAAPAAALTPEGALTFGLIWLDYLRRRETRLHVEGLAIFVPPAAQAVTCHRVRHLDPRLAIYTVIIHHQGQEDRVDPRDYTNFETRLNACRSPLGDSSAEIVRWVDRIASAPHVERRNKPDGSVSLAVRGLEFARASGGNLLFGLGRKHAVCESLLPEVERLAAGLARMRHPDAADRLNPLYTSHPEAWLESQVRNNIEQLDASLHPAPVHGQVPQFASGERGVIDLLAVDRRGRLAVIEVKATQDVHLPLQALDYWMRVQWHLDRGEFAGRGYFPGIELLAEPPRLLLVAPALEWHPTNEIILRYFAPRIPAERIGVGLEWKQDLRIMFRSSAGSWQSPYFAR